MQKRNLIFILILPFLLFRLEVGGSAKVLQQQNLDFSYRFVHYTIKDGLIGNRIRTIFQDSQGFLWIGTTEGISIFDGTKFTNYSIVDSLQLGRVICIYESKYDSNVVWIGLENQGVLKYSNGKFFQINISSANSSANSVLCFQEDINGHLWCGTEDGIYILVEGIWSKLETDLKWKSAKKIFQISDGRMLIISDFDCFVYDLINKKWNVVPLNLSAGDYTVDAIMDNEKNIWIGTLNGYLLRIFNEEIIKTFKLENQYIKPMLDDDNGFIWVGDSKGIWRIEKNNPNDNIYLTERNGLPFKSSWAMEKDFEGNFWFGNFYDGLAKLENLNALYIPLNEPRDAVEYKENIWVAMDDRIVKISQKSQDVWFCSEYTINLKDKTKKIEVVSSDKNGNLYCSITDSAILKFNMNKFPPVLTDKYPQKGLVWGLYYDNDGHLWCATQFKPFGFLTPFCKMFPKNVLSLLGNDEVYRIFQSKDKTIWISGYERGLYKFSVNKQDEIENLVQIDEFNNKRVRSFHELYNGKILVGTLRDGVFILDSSNYKNINTMHGLPSNSVFDITSDNQSFIWYATAHGLCYIDTLNPYNVRIVPELFGESFFKCGILPNNRVWGLTRKGLIIYSYGKDTLNLIPPPVYIKKITVNGNEILLNNEMEFSYDQNNLEIEYIGISFKGEKAVRYEYTIDEKQENWQSTENNRVLFISLKPGKYDFAVRAINIKGTVSSKVASITFIIHPPFYKEWWFIILIILLFVLIGVSLYNYRVSQLLKVERLRTRIASDLHDEIATNLSSIAMFSKIIQDETKLNSPLLDRIITLAKESVNSIRDIIWTIDTKTETLESLLVRFRDMIIPLCKGKMLKLNFEIPPKHMLPTINLLPEVRKNLWLILKEAVNNACKHSECTELTIISSYSSGYFNLKIIDNGKGFNPDKVTSGKGIDSIKMRVKELRGKIEIKSELNVGTELHISVKL